MQTPFEEFKEHLTSIDPIFFSLSILVNILGYFIHATRWRILFEGKYPLFAFYHSITIGNLANTILPSKSGELLRPLALKTQIGVSYAKALSNCFLERLFDIVFGLTILFFSIIYLDLLEKFEIFRSGILITVALIVLLFFIIIFALKIDLKRFIHSAPINGFFLNLKEQFQHLVKARVTLKMIVMTTIFWSAGVLIFYFLLLSSPLPEALQTLPFAAFLSSAMGITLSLPSAPANIGVFNLTIIILMKIYLEQNAIKVDDTLEAQIVASSIVIHLGSLIPDFVMGSLSMIKMSRLN